MNVLLLKGGNSSERVISLLSAENVSQALKSAGFNVTEYDTKLGAEGLKELVVNNDVAFIALHGEGGEDGYIQRILESGGIPYLGADSKSSELAFDKVATHELLEKNGIKMPKYEVVTKDSLETSYLIKGTFVAKPIRGGSSIDTVISRDIAQPKKAEVKKLLNTYDSLLLEELIVGQEVTVPILGESALPPVLAIPPDGEEFDYQNKYNGRSQEIVPIPEGIIYHEIQEELKQIAEKVHQSVGARHLSRVDFMVGDNNELYVLEINTIPGMTKESFYPKSAKAAGISIVELVKKLVELVMEKKG